MACASSVGEGCAAQEGAEASLIRLLHERRTVLPKRLADPGPRPQEIEAILGAAAAAPDHGRILPWRLVIVPRQLRWRLADVFEQSLLQRDPLAGPEQRQRAREKAHRSPFLLLCVARLRPELGPAPSTERVLSAGCAFQNVLLAATALGYGSALTTGKALQFEGLRKLFELEACEQPLCFLSIGTALAGGSRRTRPALREYLSVLGDPSGTVVQ